MIKLKVNTVTKIKQHYLTNVITVLHINMHIY